MNTHYRVSDIRSEKPHPVGQAIGLTRVYSTHSMGATFITTALENGAILDDCSALPAHRAWHGRGNNPAKSASLLRCIDVQMFAAAQEDTLWP